MSSGHGHWLSFTGKQFFFTSSFTGAIQLVPQSWLFIPFANALKQTHAGPQHSTGGRLVPQPAKRYLWKVKPMWEFKEHQDMKIGEALLPFLDKIWQTWFTKIHVKQNSPKCDLASQKERAETWNYQTCKQKQKAMHPTMPLCSSGCFGCLQMRAQHEPWQLILRGDDFLIKSEGQAVHLGFVVPTQSRPLQSSSQTKINHNVIEIPRHGCFASPKLTLLKWTILWFLLAVNIYMCWQELTNHVHSHNP